MALVLSLRVGEAFFVGPQSVRYTLIGVQANSLTVQEERGPIFEIDDRKGVEIHPDVFASSGIGNEPYSRIGKLALRAPRSIIIERESRVRGV